MKQFKEIHRPLNTVSHRMAELSHTGQIHHGRHQSGIRRVIALMVLAFAACTGIAAGPATEAPDELGYVTLGSGIESEASAVRAPDISELEAGGTNAPKMPVAPVELEGTEVLVDTPAPDGGSWDELLKDLPTPKLQSSSVGGVL